MASGSNPGRAIRKKGGVVARLISWWKPIAAAVLLCLLMLAFRPTHEVERQISDRLLSSQSIPASPKFSLIEIDAADRRAYYGATVISRRGLARLLETLHGQGVERVMIDFYLAEPVKQESDDLLQAAIAKFDPQDIALVSGANPRELPHEMFARHATVLDARLTPDRDGFNRLLGSNRRTWGDNPAHWLANGTLDQSAAPLDLRIDNQGYSSASMLEVLGGEANFAGKTVIISPSPEVAPSRAYVPFAPVASRATILAMAAQSASSDFHAQIATGAAANRILLAFACLLGLIIATTAASGRALVVRALMGAILVIILSITILKETGAAVAPATALGAFFIFLNVTVIHRLGILPMMDSFMRGDISPEEAWAWRTCEQAENAAVMFGANGSIKRHNQAAGTIAADLRESLVALCLPRFGERAEQLEYTDAMGKDWAFDLEWPFSHLPIVVLRDRTAEEALKQSLFEQAFTDDLTGCLNRRGFEKALIDASRTGSPYSVFFIDMNRFKQVNDSYGHDIGDELLVEVASRLSKVAARDDTVARLGGDEFAIIRESDGNRKLAETFASLIAETVARPLKFDDPAVTLWPECAVGFALSDAETDDPRELLREADIAMYEDKRLLHKAAARNAA